MRMPGRSRMPYAVTAGLESVWPRTELYAVASTSSSRAGRAGRSHEQAESPRRAAREQGDAAVSVWGSGPWRICDPAGST
jgi:hypothetical protein